MVADIFLKKSDFYNYKFLIYGFVLYGMATIPVALAFKRMDFGSVFIAWESITVISALIIASLLFKESFSVYKVSALILAIAAIYLSSK